VQAASTTTGGDPVNISPTPMNRRLTMRRMDEVISSVKRQNAVRGARWLAQA
jgi:hypothetical protein